MRGKLNLTDTTFLGQRLNGVYPKNACLQNCVRIHFRQCRRTFQIDRIHAQAPPNLVNPDIGLIISLDIVERQPFCTQNYIILAVGRRQVQNLQVHAVLKLTKLNWRVQKFHLTLHGRTPRSGPIRAIRCALFQKRFQSLSIPLYPRGGCGLYLRRVIQHELGRNTTTLTFYKNAVTSFDFQTGHLNLPIFNLLKFHC